MSRLSHYLRNRNKNNIIVCIENFYDFSKDFNKNVRFDYWNENCYGSFYNFNYGIEDNCFTILEFKKDFVKLTVVDKFNHKNKSDDFFYFNRFTIDYFKIKILNLIRDVNEIRKEQEKNTLSYKIIIFIKSIDNFTDSLFKSRSSSKKKKKRLSSYNSGFSSSSFDFYDFGD